ncbi:DUF1353 domain-containing protein [Propionibacteriaceae bacterium Y1685]
MGYFFDAETGGPARLELLSIDGHDFQVLRRLGHHSDAYEVPFVFPADLETFRTDMASVPNVFTWLVPRSGEFLPAAVLHDAIVGDDANHTGPRVDRVEGDRVFRAAMADLGTGRVRVWLMWAAVSMVTLWVAPHHRWWHRAALLLTLISITIIGLLATADLADVWNVLPWMGERPLVTELVGGALGAVIIPALLALSWGRLWLAGVITGWALAFLVHVTILVSAVYALYWLVERVVSGPRDDHSVHWESRWSRR